MNLVPRSMLKNLNSVKWPWAWSSTENETVYRRTGSCMRPLDKELYAELYTEAGFVPGGDKPGTEPDPDPTDPNEGTGEAGGTTPPETDDE